jgi:hypothetical protein
LLRVIIVTIQPTLLKAKKSEIALKAANPDLDVPDSDIAKEFDEN